MPEKVFQSIATREGTVEKIPVNSKDITNKQYVDSGIVTLLVGTLLVTSIVIGGLIRMSEIDGVLWINASTYINGSLDVRDQFNASSGYIGPDEIATLNDLVAGNVTITSELEVKNDEPITMEKGDPVYFTGYISGLALQRVKFANNTNASKHADCIIAETLAAGKRGQCVETGHVTKTDTSNFVFGDDLYLDTGGNLTPLKPINANCIQKVGMVLRSHASKGLI